METNESTPDPRQVRRSRISLVLIFVLFLIPPVAAWVTWQYLGTEGVEGTTNAGTLVTPARPLQIDGLPLAGGSTFAERDLRGRWTYVMFASSTCDETCKQQLYLTRQTRVAMNKDIPRVQRLLVLLDAPDESFTRFLTDEHQDLQWVVLADDATGLLAQFRGAGFAPEGVQYFLVDPLGNLMMYYDLQVPARGMRDDLRKLLKISQIG